MTTPNVAAPAPSGDGHHSALKPPLEPLCARPRTSPASKDSRGVTPGAGTPHRPRLLDLFCGAGGAARGYQQAGFYVVGVDNRPQPNYCGDEFIEYDAMQVLENLAEYPGQGWDAIHASPPCQDYSATKNIHGGKTDYPRLIEPVRQACKATGLPWVIENVEGSPLARQPTFDGTYGVELCGSMFGRTYRWRGVRVYLQRHRLFEASFPVGQPGCRHHIGHRAVTVAGHGRPDMDCERGEFFAGPGYAEMCRDLMGINWMPRDELCESIPPAYTEYIGARMLEHLAERGEGAA